MAQGLAQRFQQLVDQLAQGNKKKFAELTGKSASHIYKICRGSSRPSMAYLHSLYEEFSVDLNWLLTGERLDGNSPIAAVNQDKDILMTPMFDIQASAGFGAEVSEENINDYFTIDKRWLANQLRISSDNLAFVSIRGDSMEPTLSESDDVLVDLSQKHIRNGNIYLLHTEQGLMAKRLQQNNNGEITVNSDNTEYESWTIDPIDPGENAVVGKVVWCTRRL